MELVAGGRHLCAQLRGQILAGQLSYLFFSTTMKNILVPTDFSPEAHHAFEVAVQLARRTGGRVLVLHVVEMPETAQFSTYGGPVAGGDTTGAHGSLEDVFVLKLLQATKRRMHQLIAEAAELAPGVPVQDMVHTTRLHTAIMQVIEEKQIDLVVMGAQGHTVAEHFFMGSNTERLVRTAPCPVLAVKHPMPNLDVQNLVFPSDFAAEADCAAPELRAMLALFPEATLHLLNVVPSAAQRAPALEKITRFAHRHQLARTLSAVVEAASPSVGIPEYAQQVPAGLVILPTHGRTGLSRFLQSSIAEQVATHAFPPVLTFRLGHSRGLADPTPAAGATLQSA
ncbi:universal stress protein [Hymenobacter sp. BT18]|uniref:universal stress protein n=1 Tax=Hymenobacter sp. BT18 TaxID=2835648 RepID=UPI00143E422B|nr:universal stress protein [Hymenobacter sp. BT18]QIX62313.1 universal stress protein [Hymenobacter sp. BT18]